MVLAGGRRRGCRALYRVFQNYDMNIDDDDHYDNFFNDLDRKTTANHARRVVFEIPFGESRGSAFPGFLLVLFLSHSGAARSAPTLPD
jgi:hypothetical protein